MLCVCETHWTVITIIITTKERGKFSLSKYYHCVVRLLHNLSSSQYVCLFVFVCGVRLMVDFWNYNSTRTNLFRTQTLASMRTNTKRVRRRIEKQQQHTKMDLNRKKLCVTQASGKRARNRKLWRHVYVNYLFYHPLKPKGVGISIFKRWNRNDNSKTRSEMKTRKNTESKHITERQFKEKKKNVREKKTVFFCQIYR